jgi:hypothetical protein
MFCEPLLIDEIIACDVLSIRPTQLRRMIARGQVPCKLLPGGEKRFDPCELREWVNQLRHTDAVPA